MCQKLPNLAVGVQKLTVFQLKLPAVGHHSEICENYLCVLVADPEVIINAVIARILLIMPDHQGLKLIWVSLHTTHLLPPPQEEQRI